MPKYRFEFLDEPDAEPVVLELADEEAAKAEAQRAMAESLLERLIDHHDASRLATRIYDDAGYVIATVQYAVSDAEEVNNSVNPSIEPGVKRSG